MKRKSKTKLKFILIILLACIASILIYYNVERKDEVEYVESTVATQNKIDEEILSDTNYTFEEPKVILDPYGISPLTALVVFETTDLTTPTITVHGNDEHSTFTNTFKPSKLHIIPVYGLYANSDNKVDITINGETTTLNIQTDPLPDDLSLPTEVKANKDELNNDLYFTTPSSTGYTAAYDVNGDVRWYLTANYVWEINRLENGNLLLSNEDLINPPYYTSGLLEMDLTGKIYFEYLLPGGYHHDAVELPNGNLLVASDNFSHDTVEDVIVEIDRSTGEIVKEIDLKTILPTDEGKSEDWINYDWFHNNSVWYDELTNSITLSGRHQDIVLNIDYDTNEINWIIGDKNNWDSKYHKYFFTSTDDSLEWQYSQHAALITPLGDVFVFDNGNNRSKYEDEYLSASDNYSRGVLYDINTEDMTITQIYQYGKELGSDFYSPYVANVRYFDENHYLISSGGISYSDGVINDDAGPLLDTTDEYNSITVEEKDGEEIFYMELPMNTYRANKMPLYNSNNYKMTEGVTLGSIGETNVDGDTKLVLFNKPITELDDNYNILITEESNRLVVTGTYKKDDDIEIILDNINDKLAYDVRVSSRPYTAMCIDVFNQDQTENGIQVTKYINAEGINGRYNIYIKVNDKIYDTNEFIIFD